MKKTTFLICCFLIFGLSINAQSTSNKVQKTEASKFTVNIDKADFLKLVYNFEKNPSTWTYEGTLPCIVDFYADWCGPCRMIAPFLEELAQEYKGKIVIYKVDTQKVPELSQIFQIRSIPTLFLCPVGEQAQAIAGGFPKEQLKYLIETVLLKNANYQSPVVEQVQTSQPPQQ